MESIQVVNYGSSKKKKKSTESKREKIISLKTAEELLKKLYNGGEIINKSKIERFENDMSLILNYDIFIKNKIKIDFNKKLDVEKFRSWYGLTYYHYIKNPIFKNLKKSLSKENINYFLGSEYIKDIMELKRDLKIPWRYVEVIDGYFLEFSFIANSALKQIDTILLKNFLTEKQNREDKIFKEINKIFEKINKVEFSEEENKNRKKEIELGNTEYIVALYLLIKFAVFKVTNEHLIEYQSKDLNEKFLVTNDLKEDKEYSVSEVVSSIRNDLSKEGVKSEVRRVQQFVKDFYYLFKEKTKFQTGRMFESETKLKKNFIILVCSKENKFNERISLQSIIKKIARGEYVSNDEKSYLFNQFNIRAVAEYLSTQENIKEWYNLKIKCEKEIMENIYDEIILDINVMNKNRQSTEKNKEVID